VSEPTAEPIDLDHLSQYTAGDPALEAEILGMFVPSAIAYVDQMQDGATNTDWHVAAHSLKGVARGVGAFEVADLAEAAEKVEAAAQRERERHVISLRRALERVRVFVDSRHPTAPDEG
jgi:HPt (histidine-containing phosphotransfer) domain-containing protein